MRFIADLHIHSHYSLATSKQLIPEYLDYWARLKGISVVGTGDFTHPGWVEELKEKTEPAEEGLFKLKKKYRKKTNLPSVQSFNEEVRFILSAEISSIYKKNGKVRKVHNVLLAPDFSTVEKIRQALLRIGANLTSDGRPILGLDSRNLLEIALEASEDTFFIPAHIWTPWFSILGSKSGFDSVKECFEDLTPHISAVETGLSTNAPMHWTCTFLDRYTLISNSDAHSPEKLGRNANIFKTDLHYKAITEAMKTGNPKHFGGTIDLFPQEGKYHYDGHRKCSLCWDPIETLKNKGICPKCNKKVTVGVMTRVAQLSDRNDLSLRPNRLPFYSIIPLKELLSEIIGVGPASKKVNAKYHSLLQRFGPELYLLMDMPLDKLQEKGEAFLAEAIQRMRDRKVIIKEGYDGEYGVIKVFKDKETLDPNLQQGLFSSQKQGLPIPKRKLINFDLKEYRRLYSQQATTEPIQMSLESKKQMSEEDSSLSDLNPEQQKAASHFTGPALITAGPGTGKTRTLTLRIAYLIKEKGVPPENILAVTFTNKAADEIKQRLALLLKSNTSESRPQVSTFHAFGYSVLKTHSIRLGRKKHFAILDKNDKQQVLRKISGCSQKKAVSVVAAISEAKQNLKLPGEVKDQETRMIFQLYEDYLKKGNAFDLDDCIYHSILLFNQNPDVLAAYRKQFPWILIDEYQDINFAQYRMVRQLMPGKNSNICVIGDPDQAIYGFRGADVRFIREFTHDYPEAATFKLKQSYRCSDIIIKASSQIISGSLKKPEFLKGLQDGVKITISPQATDKSEAEFTARSIEEKMGGLRFFSIDSDISSGQEHGEIKSLSDFAVLCRIKGQMRIIGKAFHDHSIPYQIIGDTPFFREEPVKSVIDVLKLSANPQNRFLKDKLAEKRAIDMSFFSFLHNKETERPVAAVISGIISCIFKREEASHKAEFQQLLELSQNFGNDLEGFLKFTALGSGADIYRQDLERVTLMTLHAAKGLEFKCVFIVGCEDGLLPYSLFSRESNRDEEQRLLYVGMTRAKKLLTLSHSRKRFLMGREYKLPRSPFLDNIETELTELEESKGTAKKKESQMKLF